MPAASRITRIATLFVDLGILAQLVDALPSPGRWVNSLPPCAPTEANLNGTVCDQALTFAYSFPAWYIAAIVVGVIAYFWLSWGLGGSIGQRLIGVRVVDATTDARIGLRRAALRLVGRARDAVVVTQPRRWLTRQTPTRSQ